MRPPQQRLHRPFSLNRPSSPNVYFSSPDPMLFISCQRLSKSSSTQSSRARSFAVCRLLRRSRSPLSSFLRLLWFQSTGCVFPAGCQHNRHVVPYSSGFPQYLSRIFRFGCGNSAHPISRHAFDCRGFPERTRATEGDTPLSRLIKFDTGVAVGAIVTDLAFATEGWQASSRAGSLADELPYWGWLPDDRTGGRVPASRRRDPAAAIISSNR